MGVFDGFSAPKMTDATVPDPDHSEADVQGLEPEEDAKTEEKDEVQFDESSATESLLAFKTNRRKVAETRSALAKRINKICGLYKALEEDGKVTNALRAALLEGEVVDSEIISDSAAEDAKKADEESSPSEIAEKGATEEELVKASMRAQYRALKYAIGLLKQI